MMTRYEDTRTIYSVKSFVEELRSLLETSYRRIWIEGEISGLARPASGHLYFSLKEQNAVIRCAFFRNRRVGNIAILEGMQVLVEGQISLYEARGDLQLIVHHMEPAGEGLLRRAFEKLKAQLKHEGLFDPQHKSDVPAFPKSIGVVTSASGAALQDILVTLARRYPLANVIVSPTLVQSELAPRQICQSLEALGQFGAVDVIILVRGGGSLEDLQAFNEETVARAVFNCPIPVVTGVGHETDTTIVDFVADHRAATPTAAAEYVTPDLNEAVDSVNQRISRISELAERKINDLRQRADFISLKLTHPSQRLERDRHRLTLLQSRLQASWQQEQLDLHQRLDHLSNRLQLQNPTHQLERNKLLADQLRQRALVRVSQNIQNLSARLGRLQDALQLMNPAHTMARGYAILQNERGDVITGVNQTALGQSLVAGMSDGKLRVSVQKKELSQS